MSVVLPASTWARMPRFNVRTVLHVLRTDRGGFGHEHWPHARQGTGESAGIILIGEIARLLQYAARRARGLSPRLARNRRRPCRRPGPVSRRRGALPKRSARAAARAGAARHAAARPVPLATRAAPAASRSSSARAASSRCGCASSARPRSAARRGQPRGSPGPAAHQRSRAARRGRRADRIVEEPQRPGVVEQYAIKQKDDHDIDAPGAWNEQTSCAKVAVLDTGVQRNHPDLKRTCGRTPRTRPTAATTTTTASIDDRFGGDLVDGKGSGDDKQRPRHARRRDHRRARQQRPRHRPACAGA